MELLSFIVNEFNNHLLLVLLEEKQCFDGGLCQLFFAFGLIKHRKCLFRDMNPSEKIEIYRPIVNEAFDRIPQVGMQMPLRKTLLAVLMM